MSDLLSEIDSALAHDRAVALWNRYKWFLVGAIILVVAATAGYSFYAGYQEAHNKKQTGLLINAIEAEDTKEALNRLVKQESTEGRLLDGVHLALARLELGDIFVAEGDMAAAAEAFNAASQTDGTSTFLQDYGLILSAMAWLNTGSNKGPGLGAATEAHNSADGGNEESEGAVRRNALPPGLKEDLKEIWMDEGNVLRYHAALISALIELESTQPSQNKEASVQGLEKVQEPLHLVLQDRPDIPSTLRNRAVMIEHLLRLEAGDASAGGNSKDVTSSK